MINLTLPRCAVLLAVYNGMEYIEEQIESILQQTDVELTIFVSIDVSTDGSEAWLNDLAIRESRIQLLAYGERFGGAARNFFRLVRDVDFSSFDFIAFADQDDHWYPNKLCRAATLLCTGDYDAYSSNVTAFWSNEKQMLINKAQPQRQWDYIFEAAGPGCTYVLSVELMSAIKAQMMKVWQPLQSVSLHDWFFYAFARAKGYRWYIDTQPSMLYRQHEKNQVGVNVGIKAYINRVRKIRNGWWLTQALLIAELIGMADNDFIASWSKLGRIELLRLATHAFQCRRNVKERVIFLFVCLTLAVIGQQQDHKNRLASMHNN